MLTIRNLHAKSALAAGALVAGLLGGSLTGASSAVAAGQPSATATPYPACNAAGYRENSATNPTSYIVLPYASGSPYCWMVRGHNNKGVQALQKNLNACYGYKLETDGIFGGLTESALIAVQKKVKVVPDGEYGMATRDAMVWANYSLETGARINCS
ncbi:peptidoglycan-binding protein [Streptomyces sp. JUS-F4]|uniref:peptidoglycan-binding domain-containing protein n=1 Tax=Streptomyces sp. JUS-F4 TaxID=2951988 RepID=UPI00266647F4|nr:peptidoglycan-binding domain-containing protein [Streptomyces sp. JUS-F4]WKN18006.1 peptidoglycan-binding protein [Streptomyces sp. JUS-F4]